MTSDLDHLFSVNTRREEEKHTKQQTAEEGFAIALSIRCETLFPFISLSTHTGTCEDERAYNKRRSGHINF